MSTSASGHLVRLVAWVQAGLAVPSSVSRGSSGRAEEHAGEQGKKLEHERERLQYSAAVVDTGRVAPSHPGPPRLRAREGNTRGHQRDRRDQDDDSRPQQRRPVLPHRDSHQPPQRHRRGWLARAGSAGQGRGSGHGVTADPSADTAMAGPGSMRALGSRR